jgi:hypothetical protein
MKGVSLGNSLEMLSSVLRSILIRELTRGPMGGSRGLLLDMGRLVGL